MPEPQRTSERLFAQFNANFARSGLSVAEASLVAQLTQAGSDTTAVCARIGPEMAQAGFAASAARVFSTLHEKFPQAHELRYLRANAKRMSANPIEAESDFREVLRRVPDHRDAALSLAYMLREQGRLQAASEVITASLHARREDSEETICALIFLRECAEQVRAFDIARDALARWPDNSDIAALAGEFALAIGDFASARQSLRSTLDRDPGNSVSWLRLAYCQRYQSHDDPDFQKIESAWNNPSVDGKSRMCVGFALGKALDDLREHAPATTVLRTANLVARQSTAWSDADWQRFIARRLSARRLPQTNAVPDFSPIFVIGLPRTGTTLAATLLGRDKQLRDRGELNWIPALYEHLAAQDKLYDPAALATIARLVSAQMRRDDAPAHWYLDKNPLNFRYLDFICALFPQAKIVHCHRSRRDTALSLWMQHFAHADLGFSYDFSNIAQFAHGHDRLMAHWREVLDVPILDLEYEALATDPDDALRSLAKSLGMAAPPSMADASATPRTIATASVWQARQPVYTSSIGRWKNYAAHLPELEQLF